MYANWSAKRRRFASGVTNGNIERIKNINRASDLLSDVVVPDSEERMPGYYLSVGDTVRIETMECVTALEYARNVINNNTDEYFGIFLLEML